MKKIPSLFISTEEHTLTEEVNPLCLWVVEGQGVATAKFDGTSCMVKNGVLYKRYDNSRRWGRNERIQKTAPLEDWIHCEDYSDRGMFLFWVPVTMKDYYHQMGWAWSQGALNDGTYELVGPEVQDNPHNFIRHVLLRHGALTLKPPIEFSHEYLRQYLRECKWEGIVWHHEDGRMCKLTRKKLGLQWPI